jgi:hypothetical protein
MTEIDFLLEALPSGCQLVRFDASTPLVIHQAVVSGFLIVGHECGGKQRRELAPLAEVVHPYW